MFNFFKNIFKMKNSKNLNYQKEQYRGTIKQIMKVRGLRTISLANYNDWRGCEFNPNGVHSLKLDLQDGYVNIYGFKKNSKNKYTCGEAVQDAPVELYQSAYNQVMGLLSEENAIPSRIRRNILVRLSR